MTAATSRRRTVFDVGSAAAAKLCAAGHPTVPCPQVLDAELLTELPRRRPADTEALDAGAQLLVCGLRDQGNCGHAG